VAITFQARAHPASCQAEEAAEASCALPRWAEALAAA
jgi:hypothetical protein